MERLVLEFAGRAALIAGSAGVVLFALRIRSAAAQHAVWTAVLGAMLALPVWMAWGPKASLAVLPAGETPRVALPAGGPEVIDAPPTPSAPLPAPLPATRAARWDWRAAALAAYLTGAFVLLLRLAIGTVRSRRLTAACCAAPITVGILRPRILLPAVSAGWSAQQLAAVMAHERAHVRRRDPLVQWLALLNRALFWFHPLAWWLERRLTALAEEACDAAVLEQGYGAAEYAELLIGMARAVRQGGTRLRAIGVAMPGSDLPRRIRRIASGKIVARISPWKMTAAAVVFACAAAMFGAANLERAAWIPLPPLPASRPPAPVLVAQARPAAPQPTKKPATASKFEVASIRPCKDSDITPGGKRGGRGGVQVGRFRGSPGSLVGECQTVENLVRWAYLGYPDGKPWPIDKVVGLPLQPLPNRVFRQEIKGPGWIAEDHYTIEAKAEGPASMEMMRGPLMQALLEGRFHLKLRIENREMPVYLLTVAEGGPTMRPSSPGSCITLAEFDEKYGNGPRQPGVMPPRVCGGFRPTAVERNPNLDRVAAERTIGVDTYGQTIENLCRQFSVGADREVVDRTGVTGQFDIHLELAGQDLFPGPRPDDSGDPPPSPEEKAAHIAAAVRKLGLKLEPGKTTAPWIVIERVERPTAN